MKIGREWTDFLDLGGRAQEKIGSLMVKPSQGSNHIADVRTDAELSHAPDVDCDLHGRHLTTGDAKAPSESNEAL